MEKSETTVRTRPQLNISLESEHLNPEEIKAHEADTLPMGNGPGDVAARGAVITFFLESEILIQNRNRNHSHFSPKILS